MNTEKAVKNVNPRKLMSILKEVSILTEQKFSENDPGFFQRLNDFVEQEKLSDQRFGLHDRYGLKIPKGYVPITSTAMKNQFLGNWIPAEKGGTEIPDCADFSDTDFSSNVFLMPGSSYEVTEYVIRNHSITLEECMQFLRNEGAGMYGLQAIFALLELQKDRVCFPSKGIVSPDPYVFMQKGYLFFAGRLARYLAIDRVRKKFLTQGSVLLTMKLKQIAD